MKEPVVYFAWQSPADEQCIRTKTWWIFAIMIGIGVFAYALITANFAFAVMLVMFGIIMSIAKRNAEPLDVIIADQGLLIGKTVYPYHTISEYTLVDEAGLLYFFEKGILSSHVHVRMPEDIDAEEVRMVLRGRIAENPDRTSEPLLDIIARRLKIF
jgi:hypothetical protein